MSRSRSNVGGRHSRNRAVSTLSSGTMSAAKGQEPGLSAKRSRSHLAKVSVWLLRDRSGCPARLVGQRTRPGMPARLRATRCMSQLLHSYGAVYIERDWQSSGVRSGRDDTRTAVREEGRWCWWLGRCRMTTLVVREGCPCSITKGRRNVAGKLNDKGGQSQKNTRQLKACGMIVRKGRLFGTLKSALCRPRQTGAARGSKVAHV